MTEQEKIEAVARALELKLSSAFHGNMGRLLAEELAGIAVSALPESEPASEVVERLTARVSELEAGLRECADDLRAEVNDRWCWSDGRPDPRMQHKYDRDMEPVLKAEDLLKETCHADR
jgi:hypothetical protein